MSFTIQKPNNVYFLNNSLDNLVKKLGGNDFYHLSQEFDANVLVLLKKKGIFSYDYWDSFESFKEGLPNKHKFHNKLNIFEINDKNYKHVLNI